MKKVPLVYSCSGCSSAAQMANSIAIKLTKESIAEMSCIVGVGGGVPSLVKVAQSGRPIIAIDGCPLNCVQHCLKNVGVKEDRHIVLSDYGVEKRKHADFCSEEEVKIYQILKKEITDDF